MLAACASSHVASRLGGETATWSPDGRSLAFVQEPNGYGRLMIRHDGRPYRPLAHLRCEPGYHGHHEWGLAWRR